MKFKINISSPHIDDKCLKDVERTVKSGWHTHGPVTEKFENEFAKYHNAKFAVAVSSATAILLVFSLTCCLCKILLQCDITHAAPARLLYLDRTEPSHQINK